MRVRNLVIVSLFSAASLPLTAVADESQRGMYGSVTGGGNYARDQDFGAGSGAVGFDSGGLGIASFGYQFGNGLRPEIEYAFRRNDVKPDNGLGQNGRETANAGMANLWYDFGSLFIGGKMHPYIGAGAGTANLRFEQVVDEAGVSHTGDDNVFAYQVGAGIGYQATQRLVISLGYRYLETEKAHFDGTPATAGTVLTPGSPGTPAIDPRYRSDGVLAGLRYTFGHARSEPIAMAEPAQPEVVAPVESAQPEQGEAAAFETVVLRPVNFQFDKAELTEPSKSTLDELAAKLAAHGDMTASIEGYTDSIGSPDYNKQLGQKRAEAVKDYLVSKGVNAESLQVASGGKDNPVADNTTEEGRAQNRRAEVKADENAKNVKIVIEKPTEESVEAAKEKK